MKGGARYIKPKFYMKRARDKVKPRLTEDLAKAMGSALLGKEFK